jgi:hypothetical protein
MGIRNRRLADDLHPGCWATPNGAANYDLGPGRAGSTQQCAKQTSLDHLTISLSTCISSVLPARAGASNFVDRLKAEQFEEIIRLPGTLMQNWRY